MILLPKNIFQNSKIKLNSRIWMTSKYPVVIFQALQPLWHHWPQQPQQPQWPQRPRQPHFIKTIAYPEYWIIPGTNMTNNIPFCGMDHQKSNFLPISDTISVGGCWGQPMLLLWKAIDETQMGNPHDHAIKDISSKFSIFLPLRAIWKKPYHYETPCSFWSN